jgi:branched-chain amino acid transport system permease protein
VSSPRRTVAASLLVLAAVPLVVTKPSHLDVLIYIGIYTIVTSGLCLLTGYAGQVSLGQAAFYGLGAYASAILTVTYRFPPAVALIAGVVLSMATAYGFGIPILKLRGHYLAMATLAFGIIAHLAFVEFKDITGGPSGLPGVPPFALLGFAFDSDTKRYYLTTGAALLTLVVARNVVNSRIGRALRSIHGSEVAAETLGVDTARHKLQVFALSAGMTSVAGSLYAHHLALVSPAAFTFVASVEFLVMAAVGGLASVWGAPFGAAAITILTEAIRRAMPHLLSHASGEHEVIAYGLILVTIMIFLPEGLVAGLRASLGAGHRGGA